MPKGENIYIHTHIYVGFFYNREWSIKKEVERAPFFTIQALCKLSWHHVCFAPSGKQIPSSQINKLNLKNK